MILVTFVSKNRDKKQGAR